MDAPGTEVSEQEEQPQLDQPQQEQQEPVPRQLMNMAFESDGNAAAPVQDLLISEGLRHALSGGVRTTTSRLDLPAPAVAVRNLVEIAKFGHLCSMMSPMQHRRDGYPFGTVIDIAADGAGVPILCLSPLAIHSRNILENPSCSLVVHMPGWTGLADAMVTIFGDCYPLARDMQATARQIFVQKHADIGREKWLTGNFVYFRMDRIVDIYFVGGFGTVQWIDAEEYLASRPDEVLVVESPARTLQLLNETFSAKLKEIWSRQGGTPVKEVYFISLDATGVEVRLRSSSEFSVQRIGFASKARTVHEVVASLRERIGMMEQQTAAAGEAAAVAKLPRYGKPGLKP